MDGNSSIEKRVFDLRFFISKIIRGPRVLQHLLAYISPADAHDIKKAYETMQHEKATILLLDKLMNSKDIGKWQAFIEALEESEYPYLVSILKSKCENPEDYRHYKRVIQIFAPYLASVVRPESVLSDLRCAGIIDTMDEQEIFARVNIEGATVATMLLLDCIQRRLPPSKWFVEFLKILYIKGHKDIVMEMEPDFTMDCEVLKPATIRTENNSLDRYVTEESLTEFIIAARLDGFKQEIIELVSLQKIAANLSVNLLPVPVIIRLSKLSKDSNKEAIESLLEEISKLDIPNKWSLFVSCLKESDYSYIAGILTRTSDRGTHYRERNLIKIFTPSLQYQLEPEELVSHLLADNIINDKDKDEILLKYKCSGSIAASIALLDCIQCRLSPDEWYSGFLNALLKCGRSDLVHMVDPDFLQKSEHRGEILVEVTEPTVIQSSNFRLESAFAKVLKMEHSARKEVANIRKKFDEIENEALMEIQTVSANLIETLLETSEKLNSMASNNYESQMEIELLIDKTLNSFNKKDFKFVPAKDFLSFSKLGSIRLKREKRRRVPLTNRDRSRSSCMVYRDRKYERHQSPSSGSTQSSGFLNIEGINAVSEDKVLPDYFLTRQESISSIHTSTSDLPSLQNSEDSLSTSDYSAISNHGSQDTDTLRKSESFTNCKCYRTIHVPLVQKGYQISSICMLTTNEVVLVNQNNCSVILFDPRHALLKTCKMKRCFPVKVNCCENNNVFLFSRRGISKYNIVMYKVYYKWTRTEKRLLHNLLPVKKLQNLCKGDICSFTCSQDKVLTVCTNRHIHIFTDEGTEERAVKLVMKGLQSQQIWPLFCTVDKDSYAIFIYDVYSSSIGKYILTSGEYLWTVSIEAGEIYDLIACFGRLFISQNNSKSIKVLKQDTGEVDHLFLSYANVSFPLALARNINQNTLLVSTYNCKRKRGNNVLRFY